MTSKPVLSVLEWCGVLGAVVATCSRVLAIIVSTPFRQSKRPSPFSQLVALAIIREYGKNFSPKAIAATSPTTDESYRKFVSSERLKEETLTLPDGTKAHWIGSPGAKKVMLFFHGGGYLFSANEGHFRLLHETIQSVKQQGGEFAVVLLAYDTSIRAPYPRQLQQAATLLQYTLVDLGKSPEDIIVAGDSAGGNLAIALLSHVLHPHPQVAPVQVNGKIAATILLSPWVTFDTTADSVHRNQHCDALTVAALKKWGALFQGNAPSDPYLEPLSAPENWWEGLHTRKAMVLAGADELFADDISKFLGRLQSTHQDTLLEVVPNEPHDALVMEMVLKIPRTRQHDAFEEWVCEIVRA